MGIDEAVTLSFINPQAIARLVGGDHPWNRAFSLQNPLSQERSVMRPCLLLGLLDVLSYNGARQQTDLAIFELATVFTPLGDERLRQPEEPLHLGIAVTGQANGGWQSAGVDLDFFYVKGLIERLLQPHGITGLGWRPTSDCGFLHPGRAAIVGWRGEAVGFVGELHPDVQEQYGLRKRAVVAELNLESVLPQLEHIPFYRGMPKFPAVARDLAVIVDQSVPASEVAVSIQKAAGELLVDLQLFDVYQGAQIAANKKSLAYSLVLQSPEKTLSEEEISAVHVRVVSHLAKKLGALLR